MSAKAPHLFFLNLDVGKQLTGIEASALYRASLLKKHLGLDSTYVSSFFNTQLHANVANALRANRGYDGLRVVNAYDWAQDAMGSVDAQAVNEFVAPPGVGIAPVEGTAADVRLFRKGDLVAWVKRHADDKTIDYYNHLNDGKIWRRDWFDRRGFLSRSEYVDTDNYSSDGRYEEWWRPDGTRAMVRLHRFAQDKTRSLRVTQRLDRQGRTVSEYESETAFLTDFLGSLVDPLRSNIFIVDRCKEFFQPAIRVREAFGPCVRVVPVIHNSHCAHTPGKANDMMTLPLNSFYADVLREPHVPDAIVVLTEHQKTDIEQRFGNCRIVAIPHAHRQVASASAEQRHLSRVVMLARFAFEKQQPLAVQAFRKVVDSFPEAQLHLYGYGDKKADIETAISRHSLQSHVHVHPFDHDVAKIYAEAGLSISTSLNEGFGLNILESLFFGCPVVAFDCPYGPRAMIKNGVNGFLVEPQNVDGLADCIISILADKHFHSTLISQAPSSMTPFTETAVAEGWRALLDGF